MIDRLKSDQGWDCCRRLWWLGDAETPKITWCGRSTLLSICSWLRSELAPHYSSMGRPSIDPELMIRMLVVGYVFAIRSERLICREVQVNLAYRWFCKLGIEDADPDMGVLALGTSVFVKAMFSAGCSSRSSTPSLRLVCWWRRLCRTMQEPNREEAAPTSSARWRVRIRAGIVIRRESQPRGEGVSGDLDDTSLGAASEVVPKFVSPSDPAAQWTGAHKGPAFFAYSDNYLIDVKFGVIVDVEHPGYRDMSARRSRCGSRT